MAGQLMKHVGTKPKVITETAIALGKLINEFGIASVGLKEVIDFSKVMMGNTNPSIKTGGVDLCVEIYRHAGAPV